MKIIQDTVVKIHYTLKDDEGKVLDSSEGREPLEFLFGHNMLIPGLEKQLFEKDEGDKFHADIEPKDGYGIYDDRLVIDVPRDQFEVDYEIAVGMQFQAQTAAGVSIVRVVEVNDDNIKIDGNHELAGKNLHFDVEVVAVRPATEEELQPRGGCGGGCGGCGGGCSGSCGNGSCGCDGGCN